MIHVHCLPAPCVQNVHFPLGVSLQHTESVYVIYYHSPAPHVQALHSLVGMSQIVYGLTPQCGAQG